MAESVSSEASSAPTSHDSVTEEVHLPSGLDSSLGEVSGALDRVAHNDLTRRPALQVAEAHLFLVTARSASAPPGVVDDLTCASCVIKSLVKTAVVAEGQTLPEGALLDSNDIREAALHLRSELYHAAVFLQIPELPVCVWERSLPGFRSDPAAVKTGVFWKDAPSVVATQPPTLDAPVCDEDDEVECDVTAAATAAALPPGIYPRHERGTHPTVAKAFAVLQRATQSAPPALPTHRSPRVPAPHTPHGQDSSVDEILPHRLVRGLPTANCGASIRRLQATSFEWQLGAPFPAFFSVDEWDVRLLLFPKVDAAAQTVAAVLKELKTLDEKQHGMQPHAADVTQAERLVAHVNTAKHEFCAALFKAIGFPKSVLGKLQIVFDPRVHEGRWQFKCAETHASGGCPLRASLVGGWSAAAGPLRLPDAHLTVEFADARARQDSCLYTKLIHSVVAINGQCPGCGKIGKCRAQDHTLSCNNSGVAKIEKKAHVIPHAAANCLETAQLLRDIDSLPDYLRAPVAEYLALPHNIFYMSSCFESFFDSGDLVLVKIGPPEFQFYRVSTAPKATAVYLNFGADIQMQKLFAHIKTPPLSCIDGLVVDLGRPINVNSRYGIRDIPRVSHRYLDLHARANQPLLLHEPLATHEYVSPVSPASRAAVDHRYHRSSGSIATVDAWLQHIDFA